MQNQAQPVVHKRKSRHPGEGRDPGRPPQDWRVNTWGEPCRQPPGGILGQGRGSGRWAFFVWRGTWIPAFAGMTVVRVVRGISAPVHDTGSIQIGRGALMSCSPPANLRPTFLPSSRRKAGIRLRRRVKIAARAVPGRSATDGTGSGPAVRPTHGHRDARPMARAGWRDRRSHHDPSDVAPDTP